MNVQDLREAYQAKRLELEVAMEAGKPHDELRRMYKELKELQYQIVQAELQTKKDLV